MLLEYIVLIGESSKQRVCDLTFDTDASKMETKGYKGKVEMFLLYLCV